MVAAPPDEAADDAVDGAVDDGADVAGDEGAGGIAVEAVARSDDADVGRVAFLLECEEQALDISPTKPTVATATATRRESHILRITARG